jgi:hypothetical protein
MINEVAEGKSPAEVLGEATKLQHKLSAVDPKLMKHATTAIDHLQAANKELGAIRKNVTVKDINKRCGEVIMDINNAMDGIREVMGEE